MVALSFLILAASLGQTSEGAEAHRAATSNWQASVQAGAGMLGADAGAVVRPRFRYDRSALGVTLAVPVWLRLPGAGAADRDPDPMVTDWRDPETYAAMVERFVAATPGDALVLDVGGLRQQTVGLGTLVDATEGSLDPTRRRTGARLRLRLAQVTAEALCDSVVQPSLIAAHVAVAPLNLGARAGHDPTGRLRLHAGAAIDIDAPSATGVAPFGGGSIGASYRFWQSAHVAAESYVAGAFLSAPGIGGHLGLRLQIAADVARDADTNAFVLTLEGVARGEGYTPGYFDVAYRAERIAVDGRGGRSKASVRLPAGFGVRGSADGRIGPVRFGLAADSDLLGRMSASAYVRVQLERWSAAAMLVKRNLRGISDLWQMEQSTWAVLEGSARIYGGMFAFATLHHGWRELGEPAALQVVTDWILGVGYAVGGG